MKHEPLDSNLNQTGYYASDKQTSADIGDLIRVQHSDGIYYAEVIAIETGDAGEVLVFQYVKPVIEQQDTPLFRLNHPFPS
ncbi:MAG: hypothetical protein AB1489_03305 [Acidobacteriota bacterium]